MRASILAIVGVLLALGTSSAAEEGKTFDGEWRTTIGIVRFQQDGDTVTGTYGPAGQFTIKGTVEGGKNLAAEFEEGNARGDAKFTLDGTGNAYTGTFQIRGGRGGIWNGWRPDAEAPRAERGDLGGLWLTSLGLMDLQQDGQRVKGRFALRGTSEIEGERVGRQLNFKFKAFRGGEGWFDLAGDGSGFSGAAHDEGNQSWFGWQGRPAPEFARHAKLVAGKVVDGSTTNLLTYSVRAPEGYESGSSRTWPAVLILHGSNMNARSYVETIAAAWPDVAHEFILLGLNGERPSVLGPEPRFNYSYVNFVGKSRFQGFPGTDRESPALVAEAMADLKGVYPIERYLVGGHSQGGFLTYSLLMNFPEAIAGAFAISAGLIFQCEPSAYDDESLRRAQRRVPLAIVHGKNDPAVDFGSGQYAAEVFGESGWPAFRFITSEDAGHFFARLPVGESIRWLEALSSDSPDRLLAFAAQQHKAGRPRDAVAALARARGLKLTPQQQQTHDQLSRAMEREAEPKARALLERIQAGGKGWIDDFLAFRNDYEFTAAARDTMAAFEVVRTEHEPLARKALSEGRVAVQQGRPDDGYARYQDIVDKYYASSLYRTAKRWLAERK